MRRADLSSAPQSTGSGTAVVQSDDAVAAVFPDDPATAPITPAAADMPVVSPSSSILYTLLQDLGLKATAQALCEELQRQQSRAVTLSPPSAPSLPSQASEVFVALSHGNGATSPNSLGASLLPPHTSDVSPTLKTHAPASASVEPLPASVAMSSTATAAQRANRVSASSNPTADVSVELQRKMQPYCHVSQCTRAIASLAACAAEPLLALSPAFPSSPPSASAATIATPLQLVDTLTTLWRAELRAALPHRAASGMADAAVAAGVQSHRDGAFQVAALIARAAWCELRITELVFMQELHLAQTSAAATIPSAAAQPLQEAQRELVEVAGQLVTALQELRATCGAAVARQLSRLHSKSIGWLRNAECVMAWVLRRHGAFEPSADTAQASSIASAERSPDPACNSVASPLLQPLQDIILGLSTATSAPAPSYQQCLDAEIARSAAAQAKSGVARQTEPTPAAVAREACGLFSSVRIPITVRVAMTVQRVKLLHTLVGALVYNGGDSILCTLAVFAADRIRPWWARQSAMLAQFLVQCAHQSSSILTSFLVQSPAGVQATPPQRLRLLSAASETVVLSLREQLEALAKEVLLCACPVTSIATPVPQDIRLALCVRLMNALQQAHDTRSARLDRYVLKTCTAAAANAAMSANSPLTVAADLVFSPLSSASSPTFGSEGSPVTSPVWTVRVPSPPGSDLHGAAGPPTSSTLVHRSSIASDTSSTFDSMEAARTAAQVLQWKPHFIQLLATIATGRWQAQHDAPPAPYPGSRYHRLRLRMRDALHHAQELLRLQPRLQVGARGVVYPPHPAVGSDPDAGVPLSVVEQMPRMLQLATLQDARVLQRCLERRLARETTYDGHNAAPTEASTIGGSSSDAAVASAVSSTRRRGVSPPSVSQPLTTGLKINVSTRAYRSAASALAAATSTALRRPHIATEAEEPLATHRVASGNEGRAATSATAVGEEHESSPRLSGRSEVVTSGSETSSSPNEEAGSSASDVAAAAEAQDELEEVDEEAAAASSADMDYDRAEDDMKEEVECVEATPDGRLLALLTARGRLMVLRLQTHDSARHYEEEVLIDASLPNMPSREKRLQWYESLSSFVHFSPCHRFVLAAVQFAAVELKPNSTCAMARAQSEGAGQLSIYSLHREDDGDEAGNDSRGDLEQEDQSSAPTAISGIRERLRRLVGPATDRLYATFRPHDGPCLSARWVDTRWWGGGRRSRWANSAVEPLNSTNAAATVLMQCIKTGEVAGKSVGVLPSAKGARSEHRAVPKSWRAAAGVLLSEYQCVSVGMDDLILRWLPACGVVLQRVLTEPVQDIIVSPLMAAFYVASDRGDLYMYDAWDERNVTDGHPCSAGEDADPCSMYSKSLSTVQTHRLVLPVTEEGHPRFHRVSRTLQHHQPYGYSSVSASPHSRRSQQPQQQDRSLHHDTLDDSDIIDQVHSSRSSAHYTGPVTPVFQRVVDPVGWTGLPRHLRWLLPHHWAPHTPWDAQLGRRLIRSLLRQTHTATPTDTGQLFYERDEETAGVAAALAVAGDESNQPSLTDEQGTPDNTHRGRRRGHLHGASGDAEGSVHGTEEATYGSGGGQQDASSDDESSSHDSEEREYVYTAAAAAKGTPVSVLECAAHPTPARGPLQRAYYPSGACLVYKSVAKALCNAGDLTDRQTQNEMGPGGSTHHLLSMAFSGEPQWMSEQRLWDCEAEEAGASQTWQRTPHRSGAAADYDYGDAHDGSQLQQCDGEAGADSFNRLSAPLTLWSTAALSRVLLWKDYLSSSRHLAGPKAETWAKWESDVLATTYHADLLPPSYTRQAGGSREPRWSAAELLAARGYLGPRDAWRRCAPASQRGLAATARNGRYLCIMASVGPYRKLVNPREPLRDMAGFYACVVFDVYAGAVLRVIPVCPTELSGLRGRCMWTSERHESDPKAPIYRLPCTVTVVPLPASSAATAAAGKSASQSSPARACVGASGSPTGLPPSRSVTAAPCDEGVAGDEEDGEPAEVVMLTVGGLGNCVYVFDALSGRRLVCETETARHCGESAAAAYEATARAAKVRAKGRGAQSESVRSDPIPAMSHIPATSAAASTVPSAPPPLSATVASPILPASIRKPVDVLASVAAWGRGTGFDGITDHSSSTASSPGPSPIRGMDGGMGEDSSVDVQPVHSAPEAQVAATALAVSEAVAQTGAPVPWLLQGTTFSQLSGWHLRGILWWVHEHPQPSTLYGGDDGGAVVEQDASWNLGSASWGEAGTRVNRGGMNGNGSTRAAAARTRGAATNGGSANNVAASSLSSASHMSAASSALSFFYQTLLGVSGMTGSGATPPPTGPSVTSSQPHSRQHHAAESSSSALSAAYPSYGSVWRQRRRRLLERLLRHYDVGMLWQAYVTLFSASTTATSSLAPQSAVCALVQWALSTDKAATAAAALLGPSDSHTRWIWCLTHDSLAGCKGPYAPSKQLRLFVNTGKRATARSRDVEHVEVGGGGASGGAGDRSTVPFAHILQQPMAEGMLPTTAKGRGAQPQQRSTAAAHELSSSAAIKLPPSHHQNQLHVDVVNCVASWFDANGGFYVCWGSEDGGLYIMGGHVMD
ncbi:hypothetical protein CGC20_39330 [Leishmania donovani]|uniref:Uncharacterized protein n=1 Tax=Leishmania donovani TaxID=5661 RepID=A0A504Y4X9_LEIDO|nr:hypothetical protein CGC20_39330 [Leishmania donovani]